MSKKRFEITRDGNFVFDNLKDDFLDLEDDCELLNKQEDTIITLKRRLEKINNGYGHLTHRNGLTANEWLIQSQEKELKRKDEQISEWIEQHGKDIAKINKQHILIQKLKEENDNCKNDYRGLFSNYVAFEEENEQLRKAEKINMEYGKQIVEENHKLRIAKNDLQRENEQLKKENTNLKKDLECCEYRKFKEELDIIHQQVDNKDYSAFSTLKSIYQGDTDE